MYIYNYTNFLLEHSKSDPIPELTWNKKGKTAIFLMGAPGSGKSTFLNNYVLPKLRNYKTFDPDIIMRQLVKIGRNIEKKSEQETQQKIQSIKKSIQRLNTQYKIPISLTDDEILKIINGNIYVPVGSSVLEKQFLTFLEHSNSDVIYDSTGNDFEKIKKYTEVARQHGYTIIFIKIKTSVETAVRSNLERKRKVQIDYQLDTIEKIRKNDKKYLELNPDAYYMYDRENSKLLNYGKSKI